MWFVISTDAAPKNEKVTRAMGHSTGRPRVFAHRGASGAYPEHTRAAYAAACDAGADGIEIDVQLTRDREVVCFHDSTVDRTTNGTGPVADHTLAQLRRLDLHSWHSLQVPAEYGAACEQLMTLQDVIGFLIEQGRDIALAIELKHPSPFGRAVEERVLAVLLDAGWDPKTSTIPVTGEGRRAGCRISVSFMSFTPAALMHLSAMVPPEALGAVFTSAMVDSGQNQPQARRKGPLSRMRAAVRRGISRDAQALVWNGQVGIAVPDMDFVRRHRAEISAWLSRGIQVRVWNADTHEDMVLLAQCGVPQIVTNYPERARIVLAGD